MRSVVRNLAGARKDEENSRLVDIDVDDADEHFDDAVDGDGSPSFKRNADADILQRLGSRCSFMHSSLAHYNHFVIHLAISYKISFCV
jgi:hypothetical protein